jgi:hypothetical protein
MSLAVEAIKDMMRARTRDLSRDKGPTGFWIEICMPDQKSSPTCTKASRWQLCQNSIEVVDISVVKITNFHVNRSSRAMSVVV